MKFLNLFSSAGKNLSYTIQYRLVRGSRKLQEPIFEEQRDYDRGDSPKVSTRSSRVANDDYDDFNPSADRRARVEDFMKNPVSSITLKRMLNESSSFVDLQAYSSAPPGGAAAAVAVPKVLHRRDVSAAGGSAIAPYPKYGMNPDKFRRMDQTKFSYRPSSVQAQQTSIIVFPGQGSQYVGMAKKLLPFPNVKEMFEKASEILKYDLLSLCMTGPSAELNKTVNCQPALFVCSLAAVEKLKQQKPHAIENCIATAGFSVGEFAALVLAGSLTFEDGLKLVKVRAEAMQAASEMESSGLMTVIYKSKEELNQALEAALQWAKDHANIQNPVCTVANYLFTRCKVLGGHDEALNYIQTNARKYNIRHCKRLDVSGAFHTRLMRPAAEAMRREVPKFNIEKPQLAVYSNENGAPHVYPHKIQRWLVEQIYSPIFWDMILRELYKNESFFGAYPRTYECGPGKQLGAMLKQFNAKAGELYANVIEDDD